MSVLTVSIPVPTQGDGPPADVSDLIGPKTVLLSGSFTGSYVLLGSHNDVQFVPVLQFNSSEGIEQTISGSFKSFKLRSLALPTSSVSCYAASINGTGQNQFTTVANLSKGSPKTTAPIDTYVLFPPTGLEADINVICKGSFSGQLVVQGSLNGIDFSPVCTFRIDATPTDSTPIEFAPVSTLDKIRYWQVFVDGSILGPTTVTLGGGVVSTSGNTGLSYVATMAQLKVYPTPQTNNFPLQLLGYYATGDGGDGLFYWTFDTTTPDDGGTIIVPSAIPRTGCWKRNYTGTINILWFGAVFGGDVQPGVDPTANQINIVKAITAGNTVQNKVYCPAGIYMIYPGMDLTGLARVSLEGDGAQWTNAPGTCFRLQVPAGQPSPVPYVVQLSGTPQVSHIWFDGSFVAKNTMQLKAQASQGVFELLFVTDCWPVSEQTVGPPGFPTWPFDYAYSNLLALAPGSNSQIDEMVFRNCRFIQNIRALGQVAISNATATTPIEITTVSPHGYSSGEKIKISDVTGNTAANGLWTVTVTSPTKFTLNTSIGNGAYTGGGLADGHDKYQGNACYNNYYPGWPPDYSVGDAQALLFVFEDHCQFSGQQYGAHVANNGDASFRDCSFFRMGTALWGEKDGGIRANRCYTEQLNGTNTLIFEEDVQSTRGGSSIDDCVFNTIAHFSFNGSSNVRLMGNVINGNVVITPASPLHLGTYLFLQNNFSSGGAIFVPDDFPNLITLGNQVVGNIVMQAAKIPDAIFGQDATNHGRLSGNVSGTTTITDPAQEVTVTFTTDEPDANYNIMVSALMNTSPSSTPTLYVRNKTIHGFIVGAKSAIGGGLTVTVPWLLLR